MKFRIAHYQASPWDYYFIQVKNFWFSPWVPAEPKEDDFLFQKVVYPGNVYGYTDACNRMNQLVAEARKAQEPDMKFSDEVKV